MCINHLILKLPDANLSVLLTLACLFQPPFQLGHTGGLLGELLLQFIYFVLKHSAGQAQQTFLLWRMYAKVTELKRVQSVAGWERCTEPKGLTSGSSTESKTYLTGRAVR